MGKLLSMVLGWKVKDTNDVRSEPLSTNPMDVMSWALRDVGSGNLSDEHLDSILESFEGKENVDPRDILVDIPKVSKKEKPLKKKGGRGKVKRGGGK